ncbi:MAG: hypothetical protein J0L93_01620 [Deltaproteobacteria bacterium]|nr:hypothetical protein [Deltaproteobacteria bacterium]
MISRLESRWGWIPFGLLLILVAAHFFVGDRIDALEQSILGLSVAIILIVLLPTGIMSAYRAREKFIDRILYFDFILSIILIIFCVENWAYPDSPIALAIACFVGFFWMQMRIGLRKYWQKETSGFFKDKELLWEKFLIPSHKHQRILSLLGLVCLGAFAFFCKDNRINFYWTALALCFLPCALPYFEWIAQRLLIESEKIGFLCRKFVSFKRLKDFKMLVLHRFGVLTKTNFKVNDHFIDDSDEWSEAEIKELLSLITSTSSHPISKLLTEEFTAKKKTLVSLEHLEQKSHLGITAQFKDLQGRHGTAVLGEMTWHKILQHEIFPENVEKLKKLSEKADILLLLSINRKILAAVAIKVQQRKDAAEALTQLHAKKLHLTLLSSSPFKLEDLPENSFVEMATNLLPIERQNQRKVWMERISPILEVKAFWDENEKPELPSLIFADSGKEAPEADCLLLSQNLGSVGKALELSKMYCLKNWVFSFCALSTTIILLVVLSWRCNH